MEIVDIAARKGVETVNISDHGNATGRLMNFGVVTDKRRWPKHMTSSTGRPVTVLIGIEACILEEDGSSDYPEKYTPRFDLVSAGFHFPARDLAAAKDASRNTRALENYLKRSPLDLLTHPCIKTFPLEVEAIVDLSLEYGFALEVNNTNLRVEKTEVGRLERMIGVAMDKGARVVESSDGHSFIEIGENEEIEKLLDRLGIDGDALFLNRDEAATQAFLEERKQLRAG